MGIGVNERDLHVADVEAVHLSPSGGGYRAGRILMRQRSVFDEV
jgi:hypothetical protein